MKKITYIVAGLAMGLFLATGVSAFAALTDGGIVYTNGTSDLSLLASSTGGVLTNDYTTGRPAWIATSTLFGADFPINKSGNSGFGSSTPAYKLSVVGQLGVATSSNQGLPNFNVDAVGHIGYSGVKPSIISGASTISGNDSMGSTTVSTGTGRIVYIKFNTAFAKIPICLTNLQPATTTLQSATTTVINAVATTTTQFAITASAPTIGGSDIWWWCGYPQ